MENEWINRASKLPLQGAARYEDSLRELREKYEEEVQRAEKKFLKDSEMFDQQRSEALKRTTELQREIRIASPFGEAREKYEDVSATQLIEALHSARPIPEGYLKAKESFESAVLAAANGQAAPLPDEFVEARDEYQATLDSWQQRADERNALTDFLDEKRRVYEQRLIDLEFDRAKAALAQGDLAGSVDEYEQAYRSFEEAEERCEELRLPYEQAIQDAQQNYETQRQEYLRMVEDIREQLEKAPDEYRLRFDEMLAQYNEGCAEEKDKVIAAGGLHILGTERHESRRIDNQLRGRAGRQGDPGSSRFYLSLEDDLMRIFGADRIQGIMSRLGMEEGEPIEHGLVTRAIENAQKKVEAHNFDIRKHLLEYDDVLNKQREVIYGHRREVLKGETLKEQVTEWSDELADEIIGRCVDKDRHSSEWDWNALGEGMNHQFNIRPEFANDEIENMTEGQLAETVHQKILEMYEEKEKRFGEPMLRQLEKIIMLQTIDTLWKDHLLSMDHLKEGIGLRGYGQKNPLQEYQKEGYDMFEDMNHRVQEDVVQKLFTVELARENAQQELAVEQPRRQRMVLGHGLDPIAAQPNLAPRRETAKVGRNDVCPCGSGKKYKRCHGK
jgi:hypothetical protein